MARHQFATVAEFLAAQTPAVRAKVELLRALVSDSEPDTVETIKWNSPNFVFDGVDRLTVNVDGKGVVRLILHRGTGEAERKSATSSFTGDPHALLTWHSDIRASLLVADDFDTDAGLAIVRAWLTS